METSLVTRQLGTNTEKTRGAISSTRNSSDSRIRRTSSRRDRAAELAIEPIEREHNRARHRQRTIVIGQAAHQPDAGRDFLQQSKRALQAADGVHRILRFFEAHGGVGAELEPRGSLADAGSIEIRAFEDDPRGGIGNRAVRAADDAGDGDRPAGIGNHEVRRIERVALLVQRLDRFAGTRGANDNLVALEFGGVEGVHGLRDFRQHVVRYVDNVIDRVQADGFEPLLQPLWRRLDRDVLENQRGVARAQRVIFDRDSYWRAAGKFRGFHRIDQLAAQNRGDLARHSVVTPQIGPVRQRFIVDFDDVVVSVLLYALGLGGLDGDELRQLVRRRVELVDQVRSQL